MSKTAELEVETAAPTDEQLPAPQTHSAEAYISKDYARAERDNLWRKVWLQAGRVEDIPEVGNYLTYQILDDSVLIVRSAPDTIKAFYNVCSRPKCARQADEIRLRLPFLDLRPGRQVHLHHG